VAEKNRALLSDHCISCHGPEKQKGNVRLDDLPFSITSIETAERWQKVLNQLNSGEMPPEDQRQPPRGAKADFLDELANVMVAARRSLADQNGLITMRRLNRREYKNTLRALLGVNLNVAELPSDTGTGGYDTFGSNLFISANQLEQYQSLGLQALEEAFTRATLAQERRSLHVEAEENNLRIRKNYGDNLDALERATQWAKAIEEDAAKPENAALAAGIRARVKDDNFFRREWVTAKGAPAAEDYGFKTVENNSDKANRALGYGSKAGTGYMRPYHEFYLRQPHLDTGAYLTISASDLGNDHFSTLIPYNWPLGDYILRVRLGHTPDSTPERRFVEFGINPRNGPPLSTHAVNGTIEQPEVLEIPFNLTKEHNTNLDRQIFLREKGTNDHYLRTREIFNSGKTKNGIGPTLAIWVDWWEIERVGRDTELPPALASLGIPTDDKQTVPAEQVRPALERFCAEAFRGAQPPASFVEKLASIYDTQRQAGAKHSTALKETLSVVLSSPMFLYQAEPSEEGKRHALNGIELANRLSYFLWSAPPDAPLLKLGKTGALLNPEVLSKETLRMLEDPRSRNLVTDFVHQWLGMDRIDFFRVNRSMYPRFDDSTKQNARQEVFATFAHLLEQNAPLSDLLKADYAIVNELLANFYGIEGARGDAFQKVSLPAGSPRGGLLGMAAILFMGGNGERTSPVERGAWVLRKLLNEPPPPAPANVPQLARLAGKVLSTHERLQAHQEDAQCASCHRRIDPIGFGLENFDAVGQWRTEDSYQVMDEMGKPVPNAKKTWQITANAALHKGPAFNGYHQLRDIIASRSDAFARGFSQSLLEYALGRPAGFRDEPLINSMVASAKQQNLGVRTFITALVASQEFRTK
jgi:mono/diheme cytochrome c family protein